MKEKNCNKYPEEEVRQKKQNKERGRIEKKEKIKWREIYNEGKYKRKSLKYISIISSNVRLVEHIKGFSSTNYTLEKRCQGKFLKHQ